MTSNRPRLWALLAAALSALFAATPSAARAADWIKLESPNFVMYTDVDAEAARADIAKLELFDSMLRLRHGMRDTKPARRKLPIYLLRRGGDMRRIHPKMRSSIAGFYASTPDDTYAVAVNDRRDDSTLLHEYVHHFMLQHFPFGYPGWVVEGYAEYFMTTKFTPASLEVGLYDDNRAQWLLHGDWLPYDRVLQARPSDFRSSTEMAMYYAQSWVLMHYMLSDPGRARQLDAYLDAIGAGGDSVTSMTAATGMTPPQLNRAVKKYIAGKLPYKRVFLSELKTPQLSVAPLTPGASAVLLADLRIKSDNGVDAPEDPTDGPVLLNDIRKLATPHAGDRKADLVLARAEIKVGDLAVAERLLARLREAHPQDPEVFEVSALARLEAAEAAEADRAAALRAEARAFVGKAYKADSNRYQTLIAYVRGREGMPGFPNDNDLEAYRDALDLAPQVDQLRISAAEAMVSKKRYAEAARVLRPVALDPHGGELADAARTMMTAAEALAALDPAGGAGASAPAR